MKNAPLWGVFLCAVLKAGDDLKTGLSLVDPSFMSLLFLDLSFADPPFAGWAPADTLRRRVAR